MAVHLIANPSAREPFLGVNRFDPVAPGRIINDPEIALRRVRHRYRLDIGLEHRPATKVVALGSEPTGIRRSFPMHAVGAVTVGNWVAL
jgi:hypothetical protein